MDWLGTLKAIAPTVAAALGGPLAGAAVVAIGELFGMEEPTQEKIKSMIENGQMTGQQIADLKTLEMKLKAEESERGFKYVELEFKDRDSARNREVQTGDRTPRNLTYIILVAFLGVVALTLAAVSYTHLTLPTKRIV